MCFKFCGVCGDLSTQTHSEARQALYIEGFRGRNFGGYGKRLVIVPSTPGAGFVVQDLILHGHITLEDWASCVQRLEAVTLQACSRGRQVSLTIAGAIVVSLGILPLALLLHYLVKDTEYEALWVVLGLVFFLVLAYFTAHLMWFVFRTSWTRNDNELKSECDALNKEFSNKIHFRAESRYQGGGPSSAIWRWIEKQRRSAAGSTKLVGQRVNQVRPSEARINAPVGDMV